MVKKREGFTISDVIVPIIFSLTIVFFLGLERGIKYGSGVGLVYALVFGLITGVLIVMTLLL